MRVLRRNVNAAQFKPLIGILASLLERLPGTTIRLVVFDLDQQKETLRQDHFTLKDLDKAAHAANNTDHWIVTVRELQEQRGPWAPCHLTLPHRPLSSPING